MHAEATPQTGRRPIPAKLRPEDVASTYRRVAPVYDLWARLTEHRARARCLELAKVRDGESVLEVAVGTGLLFEQVVRNNPQGRTEGIDLTDSMLARAQTRVRGLPGAHHLAVGDARRLDFEDSSFDLLINNYMFDLLPEHAFALVLNEFRRVLRPTGRVVLVNTALSDALPSRIWESLYRIDARLMGGCRGVSLAGTVVEVGFVVEHEERLSQLGFPSEILVARKRE
jgi:ubiquinone/menaquinone biosynthesis C-methylase UbiE